ncbi:MAG TPA: cytochrome b [Alphaproteobacteria bacterium]|nr:cytochrome b [Alphaproteobacteria bacterium]HNS43744.1 cytochrome b [Alphaproteobacteria bacterium]
MDTQYTKVAIFLHWLIALLIIGMLAMGFLMEDIPNELKPVVYPLHKSMGLTILALTVFRIVWRLMHKAPALPEAMSALEKNISHAMHTLLYLIMIGLPMSGWALVSSSPKGIPTTWFGLFDWPHLPVLSEIDNKKEVSHSFGEVHETLAVIAILLIVLHVAAALKHHFVVRDNILTRMAPWLKPLPPKE